MIFYDMLDKELYICFHFVQISYRHSSLRYQHLGSMYSAPRRSNDVGAGHEERLVDKETEESLGSTWVPNVKPELNRLQKHTRRDRVSERFTKYYIRMS